VPLFIPPTCGNNDREGVFMKESIEELEKILKKADEKFVGTRRAIWFRTKIVRDLADNIRTAKRATKALHRSGVSTRACYWSMKDWIEKLHQAESINYTLRAQSLAFGHQRFLIKIALDKLKES
jgi:hypothetical protein